MKLPSLTLGYIRFFKRLEPLYSTQFCYSPVRFRMASTISQPVEEQTLASIPHTTAENPTQFSEKLKTNTSLSMAIVRYNPGEERFEFSFKYLNKLFNFSRPVSETLESFADRARANLSKKVKRFDPDSQILWHFENRNVKNELIQGENGSSVLNFSKIFNVKCADGENQALNMNLVFQIGEDSIPVSMNPPEIYKIKFLKKCMIGYPLLPIALEGSSNFALEKSKYKWEFIKAENVLEARKKLRKKSESERRIWYEIPNCAELEVPLVIPDRSLVSSVLKLTCTPSNSAGDQIGEPFSAETDPLVAPLTSHFLFHERLSRMDAKLENPNFFRVVTYNILAERCATVEWFTGSPADCLPMDYRLPILNLELKAYQGDIVCLQEVDLKYFESHFKPFLSLECDMEGIHCCKIGERTNREGVATFFNRKKFELVESNHVIIHEFMKTLPFFQQIKNEKLLERLAERSSVLHVCVFRSLASPDILFIVANTHLYFHPDADHIRLFQTIACVNFVETKLEELKRQFPTAKSTTLFCGDFNCTPPFSSVRFLTLGKVLENDEDWSSHKFENLVPGFRIEHKLNLKNSHQGEELTNIVVKFEGCIDYILYQENSAQLVKSYPPPSKETIVRNCGFLEEKNVALPNLHAASDHLPLIADFVLRISKTF